MTRILVVDDDAGFRRAAARLLSMPGFEVVGEASTGEAGLAGALELQPDLIVLDVQLPDLDGFAVAEVLAQRSPAPVVVLVSSRSPAAYRRRLLAAPAAGFIMKSELTGAAVAKLAA